MADHDTIRTPNDTPARIGRHEVVFRLDAAVEGTCFLGRVQGSEGPYLTIDLVGSGDPDHSAVHIEEARRVVGLRQRHVVELIEADTCEHGAFLASEYVPGASLATLLAEGVRAGTPLPRNVVLRILSDALLGLHAIHEHTDATGRPLDLVHRAVSPRTIFVGTDGIARIGRFGVHARAPVYTAPELFTTALVDRRTDLWSVAAIAWEAIAGMSLEPHLGRGQDPPRPSAVAAGCPRELDEAIARVLLVDPARREGTAEGLGHQLAGAAASAGLFAELSVVADIVGHLVRPALRERTAKLNDVRRNAQQRPRSAPDVRTMIGMGVPAALKRAPLPDLPSVPVAHDDNASELRIALPLEGPRPADRASDDVFGPPSLRPPSEDAIPAVVHSPLFSPAEHAAEARASRRPSAFSDMPSAFVPGAQDALGAFRANVLAWVSPPWTTKKISILSAAGGVILGFFVVLALASGRKKHDAAATALASGADSATIVTPPVAPSVTAPPVVEKAASTALAPPPPPEVPQLHIKANGSIASVTINGRLVDAIVPAPTLSVELSDEERAAPLDIVATSTDGRTATLKATTGQLAVDLTFRDKPAAGKGGRPPAAAGTVKHPWTKKGR